LYSGIEEYLVEAVDLGVLSASDIQGIIICIFMRGMFDIALESKAFRKDKLSNTGRYL
jgi:hypothetical protein